MNAYHGLRCMHLFAWIFVFMNILLSSILNAKLHKSLANSQYNSIECFSFLRKLQRHLALSLENVDYDGTRILEGKLFEFADVVRHRVRKEYPRAILLPFGGSLLQVARYGTVLYDGRGGRITDDDIDVLLYFPDPLKNEKEEKVERKRVEKKLLTLLANNPIGMSCSSQRRGIYFTCQFITSYKGNISFHVDLAVAFNVKGQVKCGYYASWSPLNHSFPTDLIIPTRKCIWGNAIWNCPNKIQEFSARWQLYEYAKTKKESTCLWHATESQIANYREPEVNGTLYSLTISVMHSLGYHSFYEEMVDVSPNQTCVKYPQRIVDLPPCCSVN